MRLPDIAMIAAETSRSRVYLQSLVRHELLPKRVILLENPDGQLLPGQLESNCHTPGSGLSASGDPREEWEELHLDLEEPLETTLKRADIPYEVTPDKNINSEPVVGMIRKCPEQVFIYTGYGGVLLRKDVLETGKRFLHVHGGYLPDYKGSTTNYYSLINENRIGASSIFLTEEIDSGPVLLRKWFDPPSNREEIDHLYDSVARARVLIETLQEYLDAGQSWNFELEQNAGGETYYIIHPVLKHIAILGKQDGVDS